MLNENDVVNILIPYLAKNNWEIVSTCDTRTQGDDVVAKKEGNVFYIEVKGATSSKTESSRYGLPFSSSQMRDHVAVAVLKALQTRTRCQQSSVGLAFADTPRHRTLFNSIFPCLKLLEIDVFLIKENGEVELL